MAPMQWRDATVTETDATGFEASGFVAARQEPEVRQASLASHPRHIALAVSTSSGDSAKNSSGSSVHGRSRPTGSAAAELATAMMLT